MRKLFVAAGLLMLSMPALATKLIGLKVIDKDYLMIQFRDGEVHYRDNGTGKSAYLGHSFEEGDDTLFVFGKRLNTEVAQKASQWLITSKDDKAFKKQRPEVVWRKSKPMNTDHTLTSELDHWLFLKLPRSMRQGCTYEVSIPKGMNSDQQTATVLFDVWNTQSEAVHVNIIGYHPAQNNMAADLYQWLGDGGSRDYHAWEGKKVYLYEVNNHKKEQVGAVKFWKSNSAYKEEAGEKNLVGTDVWNIDFRQTVPGRYRLVVEDVGCSMDFDIAENVYFEPFHYSVRGYYYMRLGEPADPAHVFPVPRQPQFIADVNPKGFKIYKTDLHPWHPDWRKLQGDVWDEPHFKKPEASVFWHHRLEGHPTTNGAIGGHSDAFDWDRHLAHISNIYDMLLPYILSGGRLTDDNLGIRESGNGIPDLIDEARNEVDFFLSIRDGEAYSQGVTNPSADWTVMFQAGCTTMAAWGNAANCAMLADAFRIAGIDSLRNYYTDEAIKAYRFASRQENQQLDDLQDIGSIRMRGRDFRQMAAAFLYNLTRDPAWEKIMIEGSEIKDDHTPLFKRGKDGYYQLWAAAAYLTCPYDRHDGVFYKNLKASVKAHAAAYNINKVSLRPSRRAATDDRWQTSQNLQLVMLTHYLTDDEAERKKLEDVMYMEAGWSLGRNPGNIVEMTGLGERHLENVYSTGRNDGAPGTHPGQTPFNGTETWSPGHNGGDGRLLTNACYPSWNEGGWPRQESYFNQRYFWVNGEFTPRETMRGKMALMAYLYSIRNPLLEESRLPFGAPDFSKIQSSDYLPAIEEGIKQQREAIRRIVENEEAPTFQNTIVAYEQSGVLLDKVSSVFFCLTSADKTAEITEIQKKVMPQLADLSNEISFNEKLFQRIKYVYDHERGSLKGEDLKLLEETYKDFVRSGALLSKEKMARMKEINKRISDLQQEWGNMLPEATNNAVVWVNSKAELAGLSEADIAQCKKDAENRGGKAPYCIVIVNTTQQPILASLDNRELRRKVYEASVHRADGTGKYNTFPIVVELAKLRAEKAKLMGYKNYAAYSLENRMAKNPENAYAFLKQLIKEYKPKADAETKAIEAYARKTMGKSFKLEPYDRFYYSAKMKKEQFSLSEDDVKPYFNVDSVQQNGVFYAANRVYGLTFKRRHDIPTYHPDMKVFEVIDKDGETLALFYSDYFRRPTKRGGAWMSSFAKQSHFRHQKALIYNVCNNAKAPEGQPSLLSWDEVTTLFHEFGHALHGILSNCEYNALSGTAVARDFVEMPSQFNESFATIPEIFDHYAKHAVTGASMPADLKGKMLNSINFHSAYALGENLAATCLDMAWHMLSEEEIPTAEEAPAFERKALEAIGLLDTQIPPRYSTSYFNHVWGGGYAAGYYSYLWTEVLAVNIADCFAQRGALKPAVGQSFRDKIISRGNTRDLMQMFTDFTGLQAPDAAGLLKARGL